MHVQGCTCARLPKCLWSLSIQSGCGVTVEVVMWAEHGCMGMGTFVFSHTRGKHTHSLYGGVFDPVSHTHSLEGPLKPVEMAPPLEYSYVICALCVNSD